MERVAAEREKAAPEALLIITQLVAGKERLTAEKEKAETDALLTEKRLAVEEEKIATGRHT